MTARAQVVVAVVALLVEYLGVSLLFDAHELVPVALQGIGSLAPIPVIIAAAFLILRTSAQAGAGESVGTPTPTSTSSGAPWGLLLAHLMAFGVFLAVSFAVRAAHRGGDDASTLELAWAALAVLAAGSLAAFALAGGLVEMARRLAAPLGLGSVVGVLAWAAGQGTGELWTPLSRATLAPTAAIVGAFVDNLFVDVTELVVGTERFSIRIDPVCSGYEGMGLVAVLVLAFLWAYRASLRFPHALLLPVVAAALAFVANVVRISALLAIGVLGAPEVAISGFHSKAGWLLFCAIALGTVAVARRASFFHRPEARRQDAGIDTDNPTAPYLMPLLALVGGSLFAGLASDGGLDHLEVFAVLAALVALGAWRRPVRAALTASGAEVARPARTAVLGGLVVFAIWMALDQGVVGAGERTDAQLADWSTPLVVLWVTTRLVASVLVVPLAEELAFRGFLMRRLVTADFDTLPFRRVTPLAVLVSSVVFAVLHDELVAGALAGAVFAAVTWRTGRLRDAVVAHAVSNALIAAVVLLTGRWSLWE